MASRVGRWALIDPGYILLLSDFRLIGLSLVGKVSSQSDVSSWASADKREMLIVIDYSMREQDQKR